MVFESGSKTRIVPMKRFLIILTLILTTTHLFGQGQDLDFLINIKILIVPIYHIIVDCISQNL